MKLQSKILIIILPVIFFIGILQGFFTYQTSKKQLEESISQTLILINNKILLSQISKSYKLLYESGLSDIKEYVHLYQKEIFKEIESELKSFKDIKSIIFNKNGKVIYSHNVNNKSIFNLKDRDNQNQILAIKKFTPWNWTVLSYMTSEQINIKLINLFLNTVIITLFGIVFISILIIFFSKRIFVNPLTILKNTASLMAKGQKVERLSIHTNDEIEDLAKDTELMYKSIQAQKDELIKININLEWESKLNKILADIATKLITEKDIDKICDIVLDYSRSLTKSHFGYVGYIDKESGFLVCPTLTKDIWSECQIENKRAIFEKFTGLFGWVLNNKASLLTNNPKSDPRSTGVPNGHLPIEKFLSVPAIYEDIVIGQIALANPPFDYEQKHLKALESIAILLAIALNKAYLNKKRKEQEALIIQQSKMASMGEMIGAIAHQWKQPLNALSLIIQNLQIKYKRGVLNEENLKESVLKSKRQIDFMSQTITDFRNFFKPSRKKDIFLACESAIDTYKLLERQMINHNIEFTITPHEHFRVYGYKNELKQVFVNLFNNARDVIIEKEIKNGKIELSFESNKETALIKVKDNGGGIPNELLPDKLFKSYVSTKGESGTGIGLQISKTIIEENMGGKLSVYNDKEGAIFIIELPIYKETKK